MATRGEVLDRVTDLLEDKSSTTRTRVTPWVTFVLQEMKQAGILGPDATAPVSLVAGTAAYNLPPDVDTLESVYIEDDAGEPLTYETREQFAAHLADDDDLTGRPLFYTIPVKDTAAVTGTIRLYPIPDAADTLRLDYKANFAAFSSDSSIMQLADDTFTTAVWGVFRIWTMIEERQDVNAATAEFRLSLARGKFKQYGTLDRVYHVAYRDI